MSPRVVLVVELLGGLGDLVMTTPVIRALARAHPAARVHVATAAPGAALLEADPCVAGVHVVGTDDVAAGVERVLAAVGPDLVVSTTRHSGLPDLLARDAARRGTRVVDDLWRHPPPDQRVHRRFLALLRADGLIGPDDADLDPALVLTGDERARGAAVLDEALARARGTGPPAVLVTEAGMAVKRWPAHRWVDLGRRLAACGVPVLAAPGSAAPSTAAPMPPADLRGLAAVLAAVAGRAGVVIGPDTGPLRIAAAVGAATVALFGPTTAARYGIAGRDGADLQGFPECPVRRPLAISEQECWWSAACPFSGEPLCMAELDGARVAAAVSARLRPGGTGTDTDTDTVHPTGRCP